MNNHIEENKESVKQQQPVQQQENPVAFLKKGKDLEFENAMNSIGDMYTGLFNTTDFDSFNLECKDSNAFQKLDNLYNNVMDIDEQKARKEKELRELQDKKRQQEAEERKKQQDYM